MCTTENKKNITTDSGTNGKLQERYPVGIYRIIFMYYNIG